MIRLAFPFNSGRYTSMILISLGNERMWITVFCRFLYSRILPSGIVFSRSKVEQSIHDKLSNAGSLGSMYSEVMFAAGAIDHVCYLILIRFLDCIPGIWKHEHIWPTNEGQSYPHHEDDREFGIPSESIPKMML